MTKKTNRRFIGAGACAILLTLLAGLVHRQTESELAYGLVGVFMVAAFVLLVILGIGPWVASLGVRYPIHNTQGYLDDLAAEPEKEGGPYLSQGWRRKQERVWLRAAKAFGLYIEPDEKA